MSGNYEKIFYDLFYSEHSGKGDAELQAIALTDSKKIAALPANASPAMIAEANKWYAEMKACSDILAERRAKKKATDAAVEEWKGNTKNRTNSLLINLPTATSLIGQLIAAILEEERLTADELSVWCDELAVMERDELESVLNKLVDEQVLVEEDGRYKCINVCTDTLYPENPVEWGAELVRAAMAVKSRHPERVAERAELVLTCLEYAQAPLTAEELRKEMSYYSFLVDEGKFLESDVEIDEYDLGSVLSFMVSNKVLDVHKMGDDSAYYIKQMGKVLNRNIKDIIAKAMQTVRASMGEDPTSTQLDNLGYMERILTVFAERDEEMTIDELIMASPELDQLSNQRVSALVRTLKDNNCLIRTERSRKAYFSLNKEG